MSPEHLRSIVLSRVLLASLRSRDGSPLLKSRVRLSDPVFAALAESCVYQRTAGLEHVHDTFSKHIIAEAELSVIAELIKAGTPSIAPKEATK